MKEEERISIVSDKIQKTGNYSNDDINFLSNIISNPKELIL
jgi:hypothetical protein